MKNRVSLWKLCIVGVMLLWGLTGLTACGPDLPGTVSFVGPVDESPVAGIASFDGNWVYVIDEAGKLTSYSLSDPEKPAKGIQVNAFTDTSYQMAYERSFGWLVVLGASGKLAVFDIRTPRTPQPVWGNGKTLKLDKTGPMMVRADAPTMYVTPGNGTAIVRVDLSALTGAPDQAALKAASTEIPGGGGGGIVMPTSDEGTPLRIYVGNKNDGKIDVWDINKVETGEGKTPVNSVAVAAGTSMQALHVYQESANAIQGWLITVSDAGDVEYFDLDKRYRKADDPASIGTASIPGFVGINNSQKIIIGDQMLVWSFADALEKPTEFAKAELRTNIALRSVVITESYVYSAENGGFRVYKYAKKP